MPTSALPQIRGRADVGIPAGHAVGPYELKSANPDFQTQALSILAGIGREEPFPKDKGLAVGAGVLDGPQIETYASFSLICTISPSAIR